MSRRERIHIERPLTRKTYCGLWVRWQTVSGQPAEATCRNCKRTRRLELEKYQQTLASMKLD